MSRFALMLLVGFVCGTAAAALCWAYGLGAIFSILAYVGAGNTGFLLTAVLLARPRRAAAAKEALATTRAET